MEEIVFDISKVTLKNNTFNSESKSLFLSIVLSVFPEPIHHLKIKDFYIVENVLMNHFSTFISNILYLININTVEIEKINFQNHHELSIGLF